MPSPEIPYIFTMSLKGMSRTEQYGLSPLTSYAAISVALLLPVLAWPLQLQSSEFHTELHTIWLISASILLLIAVTADSMLFYQSDTLSPLFTAMWILLTSVGISVALRSDSGDWIVASLFAMHSLRSAMHLWLGESNWWLWPAWCRDSFAALAIFIWIALLHSQI